MESEFCKKYISVFQRWKPLLSHEHFDDEELHSAMKKLFLRFVNFQFCLENNWTTFEFLESNSPIYTSTLVPLFSSPELAQSHLFQLHHPELEKVPNALILDLFGPDGLFQKYTFSSYEHHQSKACITPAVLGTLFEELVQDRHNQGAYYTSSDVVCFMAQKSMKKRYGSSPTHEELLEMNILDPACGSGALLLGVAEESFRIFSNLHPLASAFDFKFQIVSNCLFGVDLDQAALDVTQTRLWYWLNVGMQTPQSFNSRHLVEGNSVTGSNPQYNGPVIGFEYRQHFPEVFNLDEPGFDLVIANPPYVRQESIDKAVKEHVKVHEIFSGTISGMSDLYAYFYARATQLLKRGGVSSFICSNTWMDVRYGRLLQKEFLTHFSDIEIIGSKLSRQFSTAEINTVMTFMSKQNHPHSMVLFTMLNADFKASIDSKANQTNTSIQQSNLLGLGMEGESYGGSKWSLYLHAPSFYHHLMTAQKGKFISIGELCQRTLRNNLRVLPKGYSVQSKAANNDLSLPYIQSFKDVKSIRVIPAEQNAVTHPNIASARRSSTYCRPDLVANRFYNSRIFFIEGGDYFVSDSFFLGRLKEQYHPREVILSLNSTLSLLFVELCGRKGLGGGLLSFYGPEFNAHLTLHPSHYSSFDNEVYQRFTQREILDVFEECGFDKQRAFLSPHDDAYLHLRSQTPNPLPDRKAIDKVTFEALNLTLGQRNEVYWSLCELVMSRLHKASSV
ncbi:MAG: Eco57I restriction-modification methylase domain-containing protein [Candidatus Poseidoniales archaeon]